MSNPSIPTEHQETYEALMGEKKALIGKVQRAVAGMVLFIVLSLGSGLILFSEQEGPRWREIPISCRHRSGSNPNDTEPKQIRNLAEAHRAMLTTFEKLSTFI